MPDEEDEDYFEAKNNLQAQVNSLDGFEGDVVFRLLGTPLASYLSGNAHCSILLIKLSKQAKVLAIMPEI